MHWGGAANLYLSHELKFTGNKTDYYAPANSCLNEVLTRKTGIPITLSVVYLEIARRLGKPLFGIGFPGHFLLQYDDGAYSTYIDPFRGGRLLASSFPDFPEAFRRKLLFYVETGNREDIEFVIGVMSSYHGEAFLNDTCKEVVRALPGGDPLLPQVEVILQSTGVLAGEFGFVEAYVRKKGEMAGWLTDPDAHVRTFAESHVRLLDRQIAAEQRRAEEGLEMRKRMYDDPGGDEGEL